MHSNQNPIETHLATPLSTHGLAMTFMPYDELHEKWPKQL